MPFPHTVFKRRFCLPSYKNLQVVLARMSFAKDFITKPHGDPYPLLSPSADWLEEISGESGVGNEHQTYENTGEHAKEYLRRKGQFLEHKKILLSHILNINESLHSIILHRQLYVF